MGIFTEVWLPNWAVLLLLLCAAFGTGVFAYLAGERTGSHKMVERVEGLVDAQILRRRNELRDRGRTTERRPEHDGAQPARSVPIRYVGSKINPADQPR